MISESTTKIGHHAAELDEGQIQETGQQRHTGYLTPAEYAGLQAHPSPGDPRDQLNPEQQQQPGSRTCSRTGWTQYRASPPAFAHARTRCRIHPRALRG